jgi:zeta-carotene desaturase
MGSADAARLGYATVPLGDLLEPAAALVRERGGEVRLRARVAALEGAGAVRLEGGERLEADLVVAALPPPALRALRPELVPAGLEVAPIVDVHVWLDREVVDATFVALLGARAAQWVWNRGRMVRPEARFAAAGAPPEDERERQDTAGGSAKTTTAAGAAGREEFRRGSMLSVTISGADRALETTPRDLEAQVLEDFRAFFPRMEGARVLRTTTVKEPFATLRLLPGAEALRPGPRTADPRLLLAGDWTATGLPSTIEGAVLSGFRAVEAALGDRVRIVLPLEANEGRGVRALRRVAGGR